MAVNRGVLKLLRNKPPWTVSVSHSASPRLQPHRQEQLVSCTLWRRSVATSSGGSAASIETSPAVRTLLATHKLDPLLITPTGPKNRLLKGDILKFMKDGGAGVKPASELKAASSKAVATAVTTKSHDIDSKPKQVKPGKTGSVVAMGTAKYTDNPVDTMRETIAKKLTKSKATIPYCYATIDCRMEEVLAVRNKLKAAGKILSVNDFLIKAAALTLQRVPESNVALTASGEVQRLSSIDIAVAVATEKGVIAPIIRQADKLGLEEISVSMRELAQRARDRKLKPEEFQGGSIGLSNLGMYGISQFTAIISPPQSAILSIGSLRMIPQASKPYRCLTATLSCDVRLMDYELACRWLAVFRSVIEQPQSVALL